MKPPTFASWLIAATLTCAAGASAQEPSHPGAAVLDKPIQLAPADIAWGVCPPVLPPGATCAVIEGSMTAPDVLFAYRLRMPHGYRVPPHYHPADEHLVVIDGVFHLGHGSSFDKGAGHALPAGSFIVLPKGMHHYAWAQGETVIQVYALGPWGLTYVDPRDDPRIR
jgi:quercetin dioxygenase-like cupin family protein